MRIRQLGVILAATGAAVTMSLSASPAFAADAPPGRGRGATIETFVCFRDTGDGIMLGTGRIITTPSGETRLICTPQPLQSR